ncbi:hypothetical protein ACRYCC_26045 [Actinomadura scrupuli]|uniref:hypothetical protein n=1 Tax=Actinomadura scrupuli TaxID=559629 RepID=UPI003D960ACC
MSALSATDRAGAVTTSAREPTTPIDLDIVDWRAELANALRDLCHDPDTCLSCKDRYMAVIERIEPIVEHHKARRTAAEGEVAQLKAERAQRTAAIKHALDGLPPATQACPDRHCICHEGGRR